MSSRPMPSAVVFAANVRNMASFYRELAEMQLVHEDAEHVVLEIEGLQLVIHGLPNEPAQGESEVGSVQPREDSYLKLCLPVSSITVARTTAAALGGHIRGPSDEWQARGFRACDGHDPEGNVLQVRENAA